MNNARRRNKRIALSAFVCGLLVVVAAEYPRMDAPGAAIEASAKSPHLHSSEPVSMDEALRSVARDEVAPATAHRDEMASVRRAIRIVVVDSREATIVGAKVAELHASGMDVWGMTDSDGSLLWDLDEQRDLTLVARAPGFGLGMLDVVRPIPNTLRISLTDTAALAGTVSLASGDPLDQPVTVLAVPERQLHQLLELPFSMAICSPAVSALETDLAGNFRFDDLSDRCPYALIAGARGWVQSSGHRPVWSGGAPVRIEIRPAYAASLRLQRADGGIPELADAFGAEHGPTIQLLDNAAEFATCSRLSRSLAGLPDALELEVPHRIVAVVTTRARVEFAGPIQISAHPPGYAPVLVQVRASSLASGVTDEVCTLIPVAEGWGRVIVRVADATHAAARASSNRINATLVLRDANARAIRTRLRPMEGKPELVAAGIPWGSYSATVDVESGLWRCPPSGREECWLEVGSEIAVLEAGGSPSGSALLEVCLDNGGSFRGGLELFLGKANSERLGAGSTMSGRNVRFTQAPYRLPLLKPGRYDVLVNSVAYDPVVGSIDVHEGQESTVKLVLKSASKRVLSIDATPEELERARRFRDAAREPEALRR